MALRCPHELEPINHLENQRPPPTLGLSPTKLQSQKTEVAESTLTASNMAQLGPCMEDAYAPRRGTVIVFSIHRPETQHRVDICSAHFSTRGRHSMMAKSKRMVLCMYVQACFVGTPSLVELGREDSEP